MTWDTGWTKVLGCGLAVFGGWYGANGQTPEALPTIPAVPPEAQKQNQGQTQPAVKNMDGTYTVRTNARLVVLDTVVTDKQGNLVTDLKREDFSVMEAGEAETLRDFEASGAHVLAPNVTIHSTAELDKLAPQAPVNIILLDEFNTRFEDIAFARYSLKQYWKLQPDKLATPTMLIAVSLQKFEVLEDFTQDKRALLGALDHHFGGYPWQAHESIWEAERYSLAFTTLARVAAATQGHVGHKNMIWIGRGFPEMHLEDVPPDTVAKLNVVMEDTVNELRDARVTLYTIDPAGLQVTQTYGTGSVSSSGVATEPIGTDYQFSKIATATGGKALYGRNDVDMEIGTSIRDGSSFYSLSYRPESSSKNPQKFRKIVVKVNRPGLTVTTREGYYLQRPRQLENPQSPSRRMASDLLLAETTTMAYDGVPLRVSPDPFVAGQYAIHVDASGVVWQKATGTEPCFVELVLVVTQFGNKGEALKRDGRSMKLSAPKEAQPTVPLIAPLNFLYQLERNPKAVRARIVLRMASSGRIGTADLYLTGATTTPAR